jgi:hypothetical protein
MKMEKHTQKDGDATWEQDKHLDALLHGDFSCMQELSLQEKLEHIRPYLREQGEWNQDGEKEHGILLVHVGDTWAGVSSALIHALAARHHPHLVMWPLWDALW